MGQSNPFPFLKMSEVSQRQMVRLFNFHEQICYSLISKKSAEFVNSLNLKVNAFSIEFISPKRIEIQIGESENSKIRINLVDYWGKGHSIIQFPNNRPKRWIYLNIGILEFLKHLSEIYHCNFLRFHFGVSDRYPPIDIIEKLSNGFQIDHLILTNAYLKYEKILKRFLPVRKLSIPLNFFITMQEYEQAVLNWEYDFLHLSFDYDFNFSQFKTQHLDFENARESLPRLFNRFLEQWTQSETYPKFESVMVRFHSSNVSAAIDTILGGLWYKRLPNDLKLEFKFYYDSYNKNPMEIVHGKYEIRRHTDNQKAILAIESRRGRYYLNFYVV
ncbi:unnamed protein product [Caenorhabditis nigoni]